MGGGGGGGRERTRVNDFLTKNPNVKQVGQEALNRSPEYTGQKSYI